MRHCLGRFAAVVCSLALGVGSVHANLLTNPGFESPDASGGDVGGPPTGWDGFNANNTSAAFAHSGTQALKQFGNDAGVFQLFPATPGSTWSVSAYVFTPGVDKLAGNEAAFLQIQFFDAGMNNIATASVEVFNAQSPADTWTYVQMPEAPAVPNTAFVRPLLFAGPYSALGAAPPHTGSVWWDDVVFVQGPIPEPASMALLAAGALALSLRRRGGC